MSVFANVELLWGGKTYVIPADRMMGAVARLEDVVTLPELRAFSLRGGAPVGKLSMAYGALLRYAGADVKDEDVYAKMFDNADPGVMMNALKNIMMMVVPPSMRKDIEAAASSGLELPLGKSTATTRKKKAS